DPAGPVWRALQRRFAEALRSPDDGMRMFAANTISRYASPLSPSLDGQALATVVEFQEWELLGRYAERSPQHALRAARLLIDQLPLRRDSPHEQRSIV